MQLISEAQWTTLAERFGGTPSADLKRVLGDVALADRLPYTIWSAEAWKRLTALVRESDPAVPLDDAWSDLVVFAERAAEPGELDPTSPTLYALDWSAIGSRRTPLWCWTPDTAPRRIADSFLRHPPVVSATSRAWLATADGSDPLLDEASQWEDDEG